MDLSRSALGPKGTYWPALVLVILSAAVQFIQSKQLMPVSKDARSLKKILSEAGQGKKADQSEVNAAVGRGTLFLIPFFVLMVGLHFAAALPLYWLVSSAVALIQQSKVLKEDVLEAEAVAAGGAVVIAKSSDKAVDNKQKTRNKKRALKNKRRKR